MLIESNILQASLYTLVLCMVFNWTFRLFFWFNFVTWL